jgi:hypothetical protein
MKYTYYLFNSLFFLVNFTQYFFLRLYLGISPSYSGTVESVYFDEVVPEKTIPKEIITPETLKLDLLLGTKSLGDKVR